MDAVLKALLARAGSHEDTKPSLSVGVGEGGKVLLKCHAGCPTEKVVGALWLTMADLMPKEERQAPTPAGREKKKAVFPTWQELAKWWAGKKRMTYKMGWPYRYADGRMAGELRFEFEVDGKRDKTCVPIHPVDGGWSLGDPPGGKRLPLYNLLKLAEAETVLVFEGPRKAEAAIKLGFTATASAHGAKKSDWSPLAGKEVVVFPDNDEAGRGYLDDVGRLVTKLDPPATVRVVSLPDVPEGGDIIDWLGPDGLVAGKEPEEIRAAVQEMIEKAPAWERPKGGAKMGSSGTKNDSKPRFNVT